MAARLSDKKCVFEAVQGWGSGKPKKVIGRVWKQPNGNLLVRLQAVRDRAGQLLCQNEAFAIEFTLRKPKGEH